MPEPKMIEVYRAKNSLHANLLTSALEDAGIEVAIAGDQLQGVVGEIPAWAAAPRILVQETNAVRAREILQKLEIGRAHV